MSTKPLSFMLVAAALFSCYPLQGTEPVADNKDEPLPKGAKLRLGNDRLSFRFAPGFTLVPPSYTELLIPEVSGGVRHFDVSTGRQMDKLGVGSVVGGQVMVSGDGKRVVVNRTGTAIVKDVASGDTIREIRPANGFKTTFTATAPPAVLSFDGKILAQGGFRNPADGMVVIWDVDNGTELARLPTIHTDPVCPVISANGKIVAARAIGQGFVPPEKADSDTSRVIQVWDITSGKDLLKARVGGNGSPISAMALSQDGGILAASCSDGVIELWDVKTGKAKPPILGRTGQGVRIAFSPNGKSIAAVALDGTIQLWTVADGQPVSITTGPTDIPTAVGIDFAGNERIVAWGTLGQRVAVWEAPSGKTLTPTFQHWGSIRSIAFASDGKEVVTSGLDGRIVRWDATTGKPLGSVRLHPARNQGGGQRANVVLSPDATQAISVPSPSAVFDLTTGNEQFALPRGPMFGFSTGTYPSNDLKKAIVISLPFDQKKNGICSVWDLITRQKLIETDLSITSGFDPTAAISPSGSRMVVAGYSRNPAGGKTILNVTGWDLKSGKKLGEIEDANVRGSVSIAAANDTFAVVMSGSGRLRAFDFESGRGGDEIEHDRPRGEVVSPIVFSADGKSFAAGFAIEEQGLFGVRIYDWPRGKVLQTFAGHRAPISAITFSPDGKTLATGAQDASVLLWDLSAPVTPKE